MYELIEAIRAWPVIVQGALGSALFWVILVCAQYSTTRLSKTYSRHSKRARIGWLTARKAKVLAHTRGDAADFSVYATILLYRASRDLFKGLMWLAMALVFQSMFAPAGIVGFLGCLYYLLKGSEVVGVVEGIENPEQELEKILEELRELRKSLAEEGRPNVEA